MAIEVRTGTRGAVIAFLSGAKTRIARYANDGTLWRNRLFTHLVKAHAGKHSVRSPAQLEYHGALWTVGA